MAALASIRPKKSAYKVQAHPVRSNLLSIVPVEEEKPKPKLGMSYKKTNYCKFQEIKKQTVRTDIL